MKWIQAITPEASDEEIRVTTIYGYVDEDWNRSFEFESWFRPIHTNRKTILSAPPECGGQILAETAYGLLGVQGYRIEALPSEPNHPVSLYSVYRAEFASTPPAQAPPPFGGAPCLLWARGADGDDRGVVDLVVTDEDGETLLVSPIPRETPFLQPKRWGWLIVAPAADALLIGGVVILGPFFVIASF